MQSKTVVIAARAGNILDALKNMVKNDPICNPTGSPDRGDPSLFRGQLVVVLNFNEVRDLKPASFDNIDFSDGGTHRGKIKGIEDLPRYLAGLSDWDGGSDLAREGESFPP